MDLLEGVGAFAILNEGLADRVLFGWVLLCDESVEYFGFEAAHAAEGPIGGDDFVEQESFLRTDWLELVVIIGGELGECCVVFTGNNGGFSRSCVLQSIEAGGGLALGGAGTG